MGKPAAGNKVRAVGNVSEPSLDPEDEEVGELGSGGAGESEKSLTAVGTDGASADGSIESVEEPLTITIPARKVEAVEIRLPLIPLCTSEKNGYVGTHLQFRMTQRQARTLKSLFYGLHEVHQKMHDGRHVDRTQDALKWMLDQIADIYDQRHSE